MINWYCLIRVEPKRERERERDIRDIRDIHLTWLTSRITLTKCNGISTQPEYKFIY